MTLFRSVLNKRRKADFTLGDIYIFTNISKVRRFFFRVLHTVMGLVYSFDNVLCSGIYHQLSYSFFNSLDGLYLSCPGNYQPLFY